MPSSAGPAVHTQVNIELGNSPGYRLFNVRRDIGQKENLAETQPKKLKEMIADYEKISGKKAPEKNTFDLK